MILWIDNVNNQDTRLIGYVFLFTMKHQTHHRTQNMYQFITGYQYEGQRSAEAIKQAYCNNFLLPCWIEQSDDRKKQFNQGQQSQHTNIKKDNSSSSNYTIGTKIQDIKTFWREAHEKKFKFTFDDQREFNMIKEFHRVKERRQQQGNPMGQVQQKYLDKVTKCMELWGKMEQNFQRFVDRFFNLIRQTHRTSLPELETKAQFIGVWMFDMLEKGVSKPYFLLTHKIYPHPKTATIYNLIISQSNSEYFFTTNLTFSYQYDLDHQNRLTYYKVDNNKAVQHLRIQAEVIDHQSFFRKEFGQEGRNYLWFRDRYFQIEAIQTRNRISLRFFQPQLKRNIIFLSKHFHLAFQGGGAKGLAYVGAYKAIKEYPNPQDKQPINPKTVPITSIMGSSAGGIIALAISTGIPDYQLQKICYTMNKIPIKDRFLDNSDDQEQEVSDSQQQTNQHSPFKKIRKLLNEYGILQDFAFDKLRRYLKDKYVEVLEEKLLRYLAVVSPAMAQILTKEADPYPIVNDDSCFSRFKGWMFGRGNSRAKRLKFNLYGLLRQGSLMKGQQIHDIAAKCLIKYLLKEKYNVAPNQGDIAIPFKQKLKHYLRFDAFSIDKKQFADHEVVETRLQEHTSLGWDMLHLKLKQIQHFFNLEESKFNEKRDSPQNQRKVGYFFRLFMGGLINKFMLLVDNYLSLNNGQGLVLIANQIFQVNLPFLKYHSLLEYFQQLYTKQNKQEKISIQMSQKQRQSINNANMINNRRLNELKELKINSRVRYREVNSIFNCDNLIDPADIDTNQLMDRNQNSNILDLMDQIFGKQLRQLNLGYVYQNRNEPVSMDQLFYSLQAADNVQETYEYVLSHCEAIEKPIQQIHKYADNFIQLRDQVAKLKMIQYYRMTGIELSCTSVDLDNKVLRFFNHKTTPYLPVCKAVQMTGSFPVAFKAQRWKKQWGFYNVYQSRKKIQIDLEGHQFTDGGLLANFPIKYMDNQQMRQKYFSHKAVKDLTVLLGFGLDYLSPGSYQLTSKQRQAAIQNHQKAQIAWNDLSSSLNKFTLAIKAWRVTSSSGQSLINWSQLSGTIVQEIPLLRFGLKLLGAYPNSDRNLNLQAFQNRIFNQTLFSQWMPYAKNWRNSLNTKRSFLRELYQQSKEPCTLTFTPPQHIKPPQNNQNIVMKSLQQKQTELKSRLKMMVDSYVNTLNTATITTRPQGQMSLRLIHVLMLHLKMDQNKKIVGQYSNYFAFMKFVARENEAYIGQQFNRISTEDNFNINPSLNKLNYLSLYSQKSLSEMGSHVDMYNYESDFYSGYSQQEQQYIKDQRGCCNSCCTTCNGCCTCCNACCTCCPTNCLDPNRQKQLRDTVLQLREQDKNQLLETFRLNEKPKGVDIASRFFGNSPFSNMQFYDVRESIKRLTQFLYLFIKGRHEKQLQKPSYIALLCRVVKRMNFQLLLELPGETSQEQNFIEEIEELKKIRREGAVHHDSFRLTFSQIVTFLNEEVSINQKSKYPLILHPMLSAYLKLYPRNQLKMPVGVTGTEDRRLINRQYFMSMVKTQNQNEPGDELTLELKQQWYSLRYGCKSWQQRQIQFVMKYQVYRCLISQLKNIINEELRGNKNSFARLLYEIIYCRQPIKDQEGYDRPSWAQVPKQGSSEEFSRQEMTIFLRYIVEEGEVSSGSITFSQGIKRDQIKSLHSILLLLVNNQNLLRKYLPECSLLKIIDKSDSCMREVKIYKDKKSFISSSLKFITNVQLPSNIPNPKTQIVYTFVDEHLLKLTQAFSLQYYLNSRINGSELPQKKRLLTLNNSLFTDMELLLSSIKEIHLLAGRFDLMGMLNRKSNIEYQEGKRRRLSEQECRNYKISYESFVERSKQMGRHLEGEQRQAMIRTILLQPFQLYILPLFDKQNLQRPHISYSDYREPNKFCQLLAWLHMQMFTQFVTNYQNAANSPLNTLDQSVITEAFLTKYFYSSLLIHHVFRTVKTIHVWLKRQRINISDIKDGRVREGLEVMRFILNIFSKLSRHKFSLPLLDIDWDICKEFISTHTKDRTYFIIQHQEGAQFRGTHLIFEGTGNSNDYFGSLYLNIAHVLRDRLSVDNKPIKAITCSNFQSIFGFLLSLDTPFQTIRKDMFKLKYIANTLQNERDVSKYFDKMAWTNNTPQRYKQYLDYLQHQHTTLFDKIHSMTTKEYSNNQNSLPKQFQNVRLIYMHQKENLMSTYTKILDQTATTLDNIKEGNLEGEFALEISKKYGIDYQCSLNHRHQYSKYAEESVQMFKFIAGKMFGVFGSLVNGVVSNYIAGRSLLVVTKNNASWLTKGILANRLLTLFKLKQYISNKLKEERLSPSITLSQFYDVSKRQILLNFTVINVNQQMLSFLNKNTTPNMPLWAALTATSSLPIFHQYFQANKEWQSTNAASFYDFFIYQFFQAFQDKNKRITKYLSGNIVSSIPLQLLSNNTLQKKLFSDPHMENLNQFAISFQTNSSNYLIDVEVDRKYVNLRLADVCPLIPTVMNALGRGCGRCLRRCPPFCCHCGNPHDNDKYVTSYSPMSAISEFMNEGALTSTLNVLVNSNDNLTLKWYYDKLIRLPIKIGTLDFHQIVDQHKLSRFGVSLPSQKASQTVQRSFSITKSFIHNVLERSLLQSEGGYKKIPPRQQIDRFLTKIRLQIVQNPHTVTQFNRNYFKLTFLNHTKWNQNNYNNFVVEYCVENKEQKEHRFTRMQESEVSWLVEKNSNVHLKFFYPLEKQRQRDKKDKPQYEIKQTKFRLQCKNVVRRLPQADSFDYQFVFGWNEYLKPLQFVQTQRGQLLQNLKPVGRNGCQLPSISTNGPPLDLYLIQDKSAQLHGLNNSQIINPSSLLQIP